MTETVNVSNKNPVWWWVRVILSTREASLGNLVSPISQVKGEETERDSSLLADRSLG